MAIFSPFSRPHETLIYKVKWLRIIQPVCLPLRSPSFPLEQTRTQGNWCGGCLFKTYFSLTTVLLLLIHCEFLWLLNHVWWIFYQIKTLKFPSLWSRRIYHLNGLHQRSHQISPALKDIPAEGQGHMESSVLSQGYLLMTTCWCGHLPLHGGKAVVSKGEWQRKVD